MMLDTLKIDQVFQDQIKNLKDRRSGVIKSMITPWDSVNKATMSGLEWGWISTIGATSGGGKTAFVNQLVSEVHSLNPNVNISVLFFTMEMAATRLINRTISSNLNMTIQDLNLNLSQTDLDKIEKQIYVKYKDLDINYIEIPKVPAQTAIQISEFCKANKGKYILVIYDHSLLAKRSPGIDERNNIVDMYSEFNKLKKVYPNSQYIILSQLNRDFSQESRFTKKSLHYPQPTDFFGSDAARHYSDFLFALNTPANSQFNSPLAQYGPHNIKTVIPPTNIEVVFGHFLKIRDGHSGSIMGFQNLLKHNKLIELNKTEKQLIGMI